ncbi:MAG: DUF2809 domain-containing protein [Pirellulaceae bacterium]
MATRSRGVNEPLRRRATCVLLLAATIALGIASREFRAVLPTSIADHAGDCLWTIAVYLTLCIVWPRSRPLSLLLFAVGVSFLVEFSQLSNWPPLAAARANSVGKLLLGSGFVPLDFLRYSCGGLIAFCIDLWLRSGPDASLRVRNSP